MLCCSFLRYQNVFNPPKHGGSDSPAPQKRQRSAPAEAGVRVRQKVRAALLPLTVTELRFQLREKTDAGEGGTAPASKGRWVAQPGPERSGRDPRAPAAASGDGPVKRARPGPAQSLSGKGKRKTSQTHAGRRRRRPPPGLAHARRGSQRRPPRAEGQRSAAGGGPVPAGGGGGGGEGSRTMLAGLGRAVRSGWPPVLLGGRDGRPPPVAPQVSRRAA